MRFDLRTDTKLREAAKEGDRTFSQQVQHYVRRGLVADGYYDRPPASQDVSGSEPGSSEPEPDSN